MFCVSIKSEKRVKVWEMLCEHEPANCTLTIKKLSEHHFPKETQGTLLCSVFLGISDWFVSPAGYNQPGTKPTQI